MKHPLQEMIDRRRAGEICGIPSYCMHSTVVHFTQQPTPSGRFMAEFLP